MVQISMSSNSDDDEDNDGDDDKQLPFSEEFNMKQYLYFYL